MKKFLVVASAGLLAGASVARADYDVAPSVASSPTPHIMTNAFTDDTEDFVPNVRVLDYGFDDLLNPFHTQDPGFHPQPGSGFPAGSVVTVKAVSGLSFWDGTGGVNFGAVPAGETLKLAKGSGSVIVGTVAPSGSLTVDPSVPATGEFDQHLESTLAGVGAADPTDGVYLVQLQLHSSDAGIADSLPLFVVYNNGVDDGLIDDAKVFLRDNFAPGTNLAPLPEPSALAILLPPIAAALRRRRGR